MSTNVNPFVQEYIINPELTENILPALIDQERARSRNKVIITFFDTSDLETKRKFAKTLNAETAQLFPRICETVAQEQMLKLEEVRKTQGNDVEKSISRVNEILNEYPGYMQRYIFEQICADQVRVKKVRRDADDNAEFYRRQNVYYDRLAWERNIDKEPHGYNAMKALCEAQTKLCGVTDEEVFRMYQLNTVGHNGWYMGLTLKPGYDSHINLPDIFYINEMVQAVKNGTTQSADAKLWFEYRGKSFLPILSADIPVANKCIAINLILEQTYCDDSDEEIDDDRLKPQIYSFPQVKEEVLAKQAEYPKLYALLAI